jgi:hypothetical protein
MAHIYGCTKQLECPFDNFYGTVDTGTETTGIGE